MRSKSYKIEIDPIPLRRARINNKRFYDPQSADKIAFGLHLLKQHGNEPMFSGPVQLDVIFYMSTGQNKANKEKTHHSTIPDLSNLIKFVEDAIVDTQVIITDDRIISIINAKKVYHSRPRTEFTITELE